MRIDSSGNLLLGSATYGGYGPLQVGSTSTASTVIQMLSATNGYNTIHFGDATSGTGRYAGYIQYDNNTNAMLLATGSTERMRIDSSGKVGIGTTSPDELFQIEAASVAQKIKNTSTTGYSTIVFEDDTGERAYVWKNGSAQTNYGGARSMQIYNNSNAPITFATNSNERMRITSSGNLLVGVTSSSANMAGVEIGGNGQLYASTSSSSGHFFNRQSTDGDIISFRKDGTTVGSIGVVSSRMTIGTGDVGLFFDSTSSDAIEPHNMSTNSARDAAIDIGASGSRFKDAHFSGTVNAANFNTTSDATLKTNVETLTGSLDAVKALRGVSYDWIENGNSEVGVIAQEVEEVIPDVVSTNDQGIKSVKYGNLVGVLIEAIKEQQAQIDELKAKLGE